MKSAIPQRSPPGFDTGFHSCAAVSPHATFAVGTSSVRSAPNASTFCPHRLSGLDGFEPHTGCREAGVGNNAFGRRGRVPRLRQRRRRPEVVHQHAAVERADHLAPVVLEDLRGGHAVEQPRVVLDDQVLLHRRRRAAVAHRVPDRPVALDHELLGHHRRLGRDDVVAVVGVDVQRGGRHHEPGARAASPAARSAARAGDARSRTRRRRCRRACAPTAARPTTARSASTGRRARPSGRSRGRPSPSPARR